MYSSLFASTTCPSTRIGPSKPVFQRTSGSQDQAYLDPRYADVDNRPFYGSVGLRKGIVEAPVDDS